MPAQTIGPYPVVGVLGQGGMGVVYEVRDPQVGRRLALKLMRPPRASESSVAQERFQREGEALARMRHPNVVRVHDLGECEQGRYLVTEFLEGETLEDASSQGMAPRRAAEIVRDLADALEAVHGQGILHRDLKPANVILRADTGAPVLLDFGVSRDLTAESLTQTGALIGTPAFMAPEQVGGKGSSALTEAVDVYGLGALLYALLCGRPPHEGDSGIELLASILNRDPTWPRKLDPRIPAALDAICRRAMAKSVADRYSSAGDLRGDLERYLLGEDTEAAGALPAGRWARLGLAVALLAIALAGVFAIGTPPRSAAEVVADVDAKRPDAKRPVAVEREPSSGTPRAPGFAPEPLHVIAPSGEGNVRAAFLDSRRFVTSGPGKRLRRWNLDRLGTPGFLEETLALPGDVIADGPILLCVGGGGVVVIGFAATDLVWVFPTGVRRSLFRAEGLTAVAGGRLVAAGVGEWVEVFEAASAASVARFRIESERVIDMTSVPGSERLALLVSVNPDMNAERLLIVDARSGVPETNVRLPQGAGRRLAVSPDGRTLAIGTAVGTVYFCDRRGQPTGALVRPAQSVLAPRAHSGTVRSIAYSNAHVFTASQVDTGGHELAAWDQEGRLVRLVNRAREPRALSVAPDGRTLLVATRDGFVEIFAAGE